MIPFSPFILSYLGWSFLQRGDHYVWLHISQTLRGSSRASGFCGSDGRRFEEVARSGTARSRHRDHGQPLIYILSTVEPGIAALCFGMPAESEEGRGRSPPSPSRSLARFYARNSVQDPDVGAIRRATNVDLAESFERRRRGNAFSFFERRHPHPSLGCPRLGSSLIRALLLAEAHLIFHDNDVKFVRSAQEMYAITSRVKEFRTFSFRSLNFIFIIILYKLYMDEIILRHNTSGMMIFM